MEASPAVVLTFLMGVGFSSVFFLASAKASLQHPMLVGCVFFERVNVTCRWKHKNASKTNYTLMIWESAWGIQQPNISLLNCTTTGTMCTVELGGLTCREVYCISVVAHMSRHIPPHPRCQSGRKEVKLPSVALKYVTPLRGSSQCLGLEWSQPKPSEFPVSKEDIKSGLLNSQIEFRAEGEHLGQVKDVNVTGLWFTVCGFRPNTSYNVKLRHRFLGEASPWSEWSKPLLGRTEEAAPSAAPVFWRRLRESPHSELRLVSLLWKPLPPANGRVLFYNVTCRTEGDALLSSLDGCRHLDVTKTSCSLYLPVDRCSCTLTASNFGGASPEARLWLPEASEQAPAAPIHFSVSPLNDSSLEVGWTAPADPSVSGFVVEWSAVREKVSSVTHWEKLDQSSRTLLITEGLTPMERYAVSVTVLFGEQQMEGEKRTQLIYTREGAPSAVPNLAANKLSSHTVELSWRPLPVDQLHGFLQSYTLYITDPPEQSKNLTVACSSDRYTLDNLPPGNYKFSVAANTGGGSGPAGSGVNVHIASDTPLVEYVLLSLVLTSVLLVLMVFLARIKIMNKNLCKAIPDPSNSSLSHWIPKTDSERRKQVVVPDKPEVSFSEVLLLGELETSNPDQDQSYRCISDVRTPFCKQPSPLHVKMPESVLLFRHLSEAKIPSIPNLSAHPFILSDVLLSHSPKNLPLPLVHVFGHESGDWQRSAHSVRDVKQLPGGAAEPSDLPPADVLCPSLKQHQSLCSLSNLSSTSHSSFSRQAEVTSSKQPVSQSAFNLFSSLQYNTFTPSDTCATSFPPCSSSVFVDPSYCPLEWVSYIPSDA